MRPSAESFGASTAKFPSVSPVSRFARVRPWYSQPQAALDVVSVEITGWKVFGSPVDPTTSVPPGTGFSAAADAAPDAVGPLEVGAQDTATKIDTPRSATASRMLRNPPLISFCIARYVLYG